MLHRALIGTQGANRRMQPCCIVDVVVEGRQVCSDSLESLVFGDVDRLDLYRALKKSSSWDVVLVLGD